MLRLLTFLATVWLAGCANGPEALAITEGRELHLYVSNQSFEQPVAKLLVTVDGKTLFEGKATVEGQHNWMLRETDLEPGVHTIEAVEQSSSAQGMQTFSVNEGEERWITVAYWNDEHDGPRFSFSVSKEQIALG